jgi:hypothetical protein
VAVGVRVGNGVRVGEGVTLAVAVGAGVGVGVAVGVDAAGEQATGTAIERRTAREAAISAATRGNDPFTAPS